MDNTFLAVSMYLLVAAVSVLTIWLAINYPKIINERCKSSLSKTDSERFGAAKRYFVYEFLRKQDYTHSIYGSVIMGHLFMLSIPLLPYFEPKSEEAMNFIIIGMTFFGLMLAFVFPMLATLSASMTNSKVLVVVDDGIEKWNVKKNEVCMLCKIEWSVIKKFMTYLNSYGVFAICLTSKKGRIVVRDDGINVLHFLEDLQKYIPSVIKASGPAYQNRLEVIIEELREKSWPDRVDAKESAEMLTEER